MDRSGYGPVWSCYGPVWSWIVNRSAHRPKLPWTDPIMTRSGHVPKWAWRDLVMNRSGYGPNGHEAISSWIDLVTDRNGHEPIWHKTVKLVYQHKRIYILYDDSDAVFIPQSAALWTCMENTLTEEWSMINTFWMSYFKICKCIIYWRMRYSSTPC